MLSLPLLFVAAIVCLILYIYKENLNRPENFPPGPIKLPFFGSYWLILKENLKYPHKALVALGKKYKTDVVGFYLGDIPAISCYKYDILKEVLTRDEFNDRPDTCIIRNRGLGSLVGIFFSEGNFWKDQRWFSLRYMRDFGFGRRDALMEETAAGEIKNLLEFFMNKPKPCDADVCVKQAVVKMPDVLFGPALNCIHHTLSSTHFQQSEELRAIGHHATKFLQCVDATGNCISSSPWLKNIAPEYFGWNTSFTASIPLFKFARKLIQEHKDTYIEGHPRDFIDLYLDEMNYLKKENKDSASFSDNQLMFTVIDFMFPAPVGIGHTFNILFAYLINQPEIQAKIQNEIDTVIGTSRLPTLDDRKDLPYTEGTLREAIRKDPIVPLCIGRKCTKDTTLGGYFIPKNTVVLPNLWGMHNDPELWGDPENFRPERWLDDKGKLLAKDKSFGFGAGKRLCAGETFARNTMFLFLAAIMQNFTLKMPEGKRAPDVTKHINGITMTIPGYWMEVVSRV